MEAVSEAIVEVVTDPVESAKAAGLRYVSDQRPGITRERDGDQFVYRRPDGQTIEDPDLLERIRTLRIPPAWEQVWVCTISNGHLQATGRDSRGRKQYIYHPRWRETRDATKYERMLAFGAALPAIRRRVSKDLAQPGFPWSKVLATVVRLLETTLIRVGNEEYARQNESYGLTTLHSRHVRVEGSCMNFEFRGKRGVFHSIRTCDRRLSRIVKRLQELPGQELFSYIDENGQPVDIGSEDVNGYLREITGQDFTAKDFRTWAGTVLTAISLYEVGICDSESKAKSNIAQAIKTVAQRLGNTPAICRKSYVHPAVLTAYRDGSLAEALGNMLEQEIAEYEDLQPEEDAVLKLLLNKLADGDR